MKLSVLMPVYTKESPAILSQCLQSLARQTLHADELVIVEDGQLGGPLDAVLAEFKSVLPIILVALPVHGGLGAALSAGMAICRGDYVARMDSDDLCVDERFQRQVDFLDSHCAVDVVGSAIGEFDCEPTAPTSIRRLPASGRELTRFARHRNPLNHMTVMFRREAVLAAGSYKHFPEFEDYHLWARMLMQGHCLHNMHEILVHARCGKSLQTRRGGFRYFKQEMLFQIFLYRVGLVTLPALIRNMVVRGPIRLAPKFLRASCYRLFLRSGPLSTWELNHG